MLRVTFLGTASSRPTVRRNVPAVMLQREGASYLLDCGEGTQRQMMRFGVGFTLGEIFITHLHADHYLGVTGLLRTLSLQGREKPLRLWGPPESRPILERLAAMGGDRLLYPVSVLELGPGETVDFGEYRIEAFETRHPGSSVGYALVEDSRPGRFDPERAAELGVPEGPQFGRLHRGETVELADGRTVTPDEVVGSPRPGRKVVYTGDTAPCPEVTEAAREADLLIHEATFGSRETGRARETGHSTARDAGRVAAEAGVLALALTHFSARYSERAFVLRREAAEEFPDPVTAEDGMVLEVPFRDQGRPLIRRRAGSPGPGSPVGRSGTGTVEGAAGDAP